MERRIGAILREARRRRQVELSEVEAATRIRARYLRAIEDEEWDALPGGAYTRGFIRAYASFLGLDGERLVAEYRESVEAEPGGGLDSAGKAAARSPRAATPGLAWVAVAGVVILGAIAVVALPGGGNGGGAPQPAPSRPGTTVEEDEPAPARRDAATVSLSLVATAEVWVCVLGAGGRHLVDGQILETGAGAGPFRSGSFTVSLGNGEASMLVNGKEAEIPVTPSPIGYSIDGKGELTRLPEAERPTCA